MTPVLRRLLTLECMHMCVAWRCPMFNVASGSFLVWGTPYAPRCLVESACPSRGLQAVNWSELHRPPSGPVDQFDFFNRQTVLKSQVLAQLSSPPPSQRRTIPDTLCHRTRLHSNFTSLHAARDVNSCEPYHQELCHPSTATLSPPGVTAIGRRWATRLPVPGVRLHQ